MNKIEIAKKRLEIVRLRNLADWQINSFAQGHYNQASHPIYPGQEAVCIGKAQQAERFARENLAMADLMEAELAGVL